MRFRKTRISLFLDPGRCIIHPGVTAMRKTAPFPTNPTLARRVQAALATGSRERGWAWLSAKEQSYP